MNVSVPLFAPGVEPEQGLSRYEQPFAANLTAMRLAVAGPIVEQSAITVPALTPESTPSDPVSTSSDIAESPTHRKTQSANSPTWVGVSHNRPPEWEAARSSALEVVWLQSATW